jgi:hypothetical protein
LKGVDYGRLFELHNGTTSTDQNMTQPEFDNLFCPVA